MEARPGLRRGPGNAARQSGASGEEEAVRFLTEQGFRILARNFKIRSGEIDIVARDGDTTVFVEVKRRESSGHGTAAEFVTASKRRRIVVAAQAFAARYALSESPIRFDVIGIDVHGGKPRISHHRGAFDAR